jgi:hypothetical protein
MTRSAPLTMTPPATTRRVSIGLIALIASLGVSVAAPAAPPPQRTFASPDQAVDALVAAARANNPAESEKILGQPGRKLVYSGDPVADKEGREKFVADYDQKHSIATEGDNKATLLVGADDWPMPIPLVKEGDAWLFDTKAGAEEILDRRIGRNELNAIQVCGAIVDAEHDYAAKDRMGDGYLEYAQKLVSTPGKRDGLYWPDAPDEESPIGPLVASARAEGYSAGSHTAGSKGKHEPYHGYFYRILKQQGKDASGGAYSYVVNGHMIGGFAVVAFPAKYGDSGVMTFMVGRNGGVYEKNLGRDTTSLARRMTTFNPDASWKPVHQVAGN